MQSTEITAGIIVMIVGILFSLMLIAWTGFFCRWVCNPEEVQKPKHPILVTIFETSQRYAPDADAASPK
jgi:hypothetical protein